MPLTVALSFGGVYGLKPGSLTTSTVASTLGKAFRNRPHLVRSLIRFKQPGRAKFMDNHRHFGIDPLPSRNGLHVAPSTWTHQTKRTFGITVRDANYMVQIFLA